jgi:hypothetical protein
VTRSSKIAAYTLAFLTLGLAIYSLIGIARDLSGEKCYGFYGIAESCFSTMMIPVQLSWPFLLIIIIALILLVIVPTIRKKSKK